MTTHRTRGSRGIAADLEFAGEPMIHALLVLHDHDQIHALYANLKAPAAARNGKERRRAPASGCATAGNATATLSAEDESAFHHVRDNRDALGMIQYFKRDAFTRRCCYCFKQEGGIRETLVCILA